MAMLNAGGRAVTRELRQLFNKIRFSPVNRTPVLFVGVVFFHKKEDQDIYTYIRFTLEFLTIFCGSSHTIWMCPNPENLQDSGKIKDITLKQIIPEAEEMICHCIYDAWTTRSSSTRWNTRL